MVADAESLPDSVMQRIAREFNQAETTFVLPPTLAGADWRLRSFTAVGIEVYGAGHNALGTWWWLAQSGRLPLGPMGGNFTQQIGTRLLPVDAICHDGELIAIAVTQTPPVFGAVCDAKDELAAALGLAADDISGEAPAQVVSTGAAHLLVPVKDREVIARAKPDLPRLASALRAVRAQGAYLFSLDPISRNATAHTRFFNSTEGIPEDAATGSAAGPLACQLVARGIVADRSTIAIEQGHAMGRPSLIHVSVHGEVIRITGACAISAEGILRVA